VETWASGGDDATSLLNAVEHEHAQAKEANHCWASFAHVQRKPCVPFTGTVFVVVDAVCTLDAIFPIRNHEIIKLHLGNHCWAFSVQVGARSDQLGAVSFAFFSCFCSCWRLPRDAHGRVASATERSVQASHAIRKGVVKEKMERNE